MASTIVSGPLLWTLVSHTNRKTRIMKTHVHLTSMVVLSSAFLVGCGSDADQTASDGLPDMPPATVETAGHDHPSEGPHHGHLIELGNEEYHGELVHDEESGTVTIYILDGSATKSVPIKAAEITVNLKHDGQGEQFKLAASPDESDPEGMSSRFVSNDEELGEDLHHEDTEAHVVLMIGEKSYRGKIEHEHDHGHDHDKDGHHKGGDKD